MGMYKNWEVIFFNVATTPQTETQTEPEIQPEPEPEKEPNKIWKYCLLVAVVAFGWILIQNFHQEPPLETEVEVFDDELEELISEYLANCAEPASNDCEDRFDAIVEIALEKGISIKRLLDRMRLSGKVIFAMCSDGHSSFSTWIYDPDDWQNKPFSKYGSCWSWVIFSPWGEIIEWKVIPAQKKRWNEILEDKGLPTIPERDN